MIGKLIRCIQCNEVMNATEWDSYPEYTWDSGEIKEIEMSDRKAFLQQHGLSSLLVLHDPKKHVATGYGTSKFPESYLVDRQGVLRYRFVNKRDWSSPLAQTCIRSLF